MELDIIKDEIIIYRGLLKILGFDPKFADCAVCEFKEIVFFFKDDHCFLCKKCAFKAPRDELILIKK